MARVEYKSQKVVVDLSKIIASETCGFTEAIPEQNDQDLAQIFVKIINHEYRHIIPAELLQEVLLSTMESTGKIMEKAIQDHLGKDN